MVVWYINEFAFQRFSMGYATAMSMVLCLILIIVALIQMRLLRANEADV